MHRRESRIFGLQSEIDLINIEALHQVVQSKWDWVIRGAKLNRELQRYGTMMTMKDARSDSRLTCCYDLKLRAPSPRA